MEIAEVNHDDLPALRIFQPADWPDIIPSLSFYIDSPFCCPVKVVEKGEILGIGSWIMHGNVAWLATIITHPEHRNKGIGKQITQVLIDSLKKTSVETIMLVATPMGEPLYEKLGFVTDSRYAFYSGGEKSDGKQISPNIIPYTSGYAGQILAMDHEAYGENRSMRVLEYLPQAKLYVEGSSLKGFYLPGWGEGPVIAENAEAGNALLYTRSITAERTVFPEENEAAAEYLSSRGNTMYRKAARMRIGRKIAWQPETIYSRVAGAIG
jgi:GNAT superfamily N-acetyltransferase